ncbi:hypothetical protein H8E65_02850 [Candidatus Bathyarchaeota archaeon]|nr:hypothetical protein [Candidatus Bathyarchaeota archaeon]
MEPEHIIEETELKLRLDVILSLHRALLGEISTPLRGVTVGWSHENREITVHALFDGEISEADRASMDMVETEMMADFPANFDVNVTCFRIDAPENLNEYTLQEWAYRRREYDPLE